MSNIKKLVDDFLADLEKNISNKDDLEYVTLRSKIFISSMYDIIEYLFNYKEDKIKAIENIQSALGKKMSNLEKNISEIRQDLELEDYDELGIEELADLNEEPIDMGIDEDEYDTELVCPYCESEIIVDLSQEMKELKCPECNNIIELDWSGNFEENQNFNGCNGGHCSKCNGCSNEDNDEDDM